jgi:hypothetical protein
MLELKTKILFDPDNLTRKHDKQSSWKRVVICTTTCDIDDYYAWFLKKRFNLILNKNLRVPHITIVNDRITDHKLFEMGKKLFNGKELIFNYDPADIKSNGEHWWIRTPNTDAENIRQVLGLPAKLGSPDKPIGMHLTLGHSNEKYIAHSKYILETIMRYNL